MKCEVDSSDDDDFRIMDSMPISLDLDYRFHHPNAYRLLNEESQDSKTFKDFLISLVLTHHGQPIPRTKEYNSKLLNCLYKEEEAQLFFARSFGYVMTAKKD